MQIRRLVAGTTVALATAAGVPAVAAAAPVSPSGAVLAAHEFPSGSTGYKVEKEKLSELAGVPEKGEGGSPCATKADALAKALDGAEVVEAEAKRGSVEFEASVIGGRLTTANRDAVTACRSSLPAEKRTVAREAPADLTHLRPFIFAVGDSELQGWADVRGVTVLVSAEGEKGAAVDSEGFWQTLRAQIAKVERQP
ncbi:hypothetical protein [Tsukamurella sp. 1534]|uniref:hypothetical protein n=1 Tax=Tsukamurella sp. 1534 TaxID=1151061 RepID=UPI0003115B7E|nr:hypothetical protein [Tsukamurella sp. 1534]